MDHLLLVRFRIDKEKINDFALWRKEMDSLNRNQPGFVDSSVLEPSDADGYYYLTLRFRSEQDAQNWINSEKRKTMLSSAEVSGLRDMDEHITSWEEYWKKPSGGANPFKQVLLTFVAVYPLTMVFPALVRKILPSYGIDLGNFFGGIVIGLCITIMMNFVMMPFIMKNFGKWMRK